MSGLFMCEMLCRNAIKTVFSKTKRKLCNNLEYQGIFFFITEHCQVCGPIFFEEFATDTYQTSYIYTAWKVVWHIFSLNKKSEEYDIGKKAEFGQISL